MSHPQTPLYKHKYFHCPGAGFDPSLCSHDMGAFPEDFHRCVQDNYDFCTPASDLFNSQGAQYIRRPSTRSAELFLRFPRELHGSIFRMALPSVELHTPMLPKFSLETYPGSRRHRELTELIAVTKNLRSVCRRFRAVVLDEYFTHVSVFVHKLGEWTRDPDVDFTPEKFMRFFPTLRSVLLLVSCRELPPWKPVSLKSAAELLSCFPEFAALVTAVKHTTDRRVWIPTEREPEYPKALNYIKETLRRWVQLRYSPEYPKTSKQRLEELCLDHISLDCYVSDDAFFRRVQSGNYVFDAFDDYDSWPTTLDRDSWKQNWHGKNLIDLLMYTTEGVEKVATAVCDLIKESEEDYIDLARRCPNIAVLELSSVVFQVLPLTVWAPFLLSLRKLYRLEIVGRKLEIAEGAEDESVLSLKSCNAREIRAEAEKALTGKGETMDQLYVKIFNGEGTEEEMVLVKQGLGFSGLTELEIHHDLTDCGEFSSVLFKAIAGKIEKLKRLHVSSWETSYHDEIGDLLLASRNTLQHFYYKPQQRNREGWETQYMRSRHPLKHHLCPLIAAAPRLSFVEIDIVSICREIFETPDNGRYEGIIGFRESCLGISPLWNMWKTSFKGHSYRLRQVLEAARVMEDLGNLRGPWVGRGLLLSVNAKYDVDQVFVDPPPGEAWFFSPAHKLVHLPICPKSFEYDQNHQLPPTPCSVCDSALTIADLHARNAKYLDPNTGREMMERFENAHNGFWRNKLHRYMFKCWYRARKTMDEDEFFDMMDHGGQNWIWYSFGDSLLTDHHFSDIELDEMEENGELYHSD